MQFYDILVVSPLYRECKIYLSTIFAHSMPFLILYCKFFIASYRMGWCVGSPYQKGNPLYPSNSSLQFLCNVTFPSLDMLPWMNEGGVGYDKCPDKNKGIYKNKH